MAIVKAPPSQSGSSYAYSLSLAALIMVNPVALLKLSTTELYARTSTKLVRKAIVANDRHNFESQSDIYQKEEKADFMNFLKNLR